MTKAFFCLPHTNQMNDGSEETNNSTARRNTSDTTLQVEILSSRMNLATENATIYVKFDIVLLPSLIAAIPNSESASQVRAHNDNQSQ